MFIPLELMAIGVLFVAAFDAVRLVGVSSTASENIEHRQLAAIELNNHAPPIAPTCVSRARLNGH